MNGIKFLVVRGFGRLVRTMHILSYIPSFVCQDIRSKNSDNYVIAIVLTQLYIILERTGDILKGLC